MLRIQHHLSWLLAIILPFILIGSLQEFPGNADGAELLLTSLKGGVPHPPGFPIQLWLNKLWLSLSPYSPEKTLSFSNWFYFFLSALLLHFWLGLNHLHWSVKSLTLLIFIGFNPIQEMAINIEKYSLLNLLFLSTLVFAQTYWYRQKRAYLYLSVLSMALAFSHHYTAIVLFPIFFSLTHFNKRDLLGAISFLFIIPSLFYFSLLSFSSSALWPNWANLESFSDIISYFFAMNHGDHSVSSISLGSENTLNATEIFFNHLGLLIPLFLIGLTTIFKTRKKLIPIVIIPCLSFLLLNLLFNSPDTLFIKGYFSRYSSSAMIFAILPMAYGLSFLLNKGKFLIQLSLYVLIFTIFSTHLFLKPSNNSFQQVYHDSMVNDFKTEAVFLSQEDFVSFYGLQKKRFPIIPAFYYDWYQEKAIKIEPRLKSHLDTMKNKNWDFFDLAQVLYQSGLPIMSTERTTLKKINQPIVQHGLLFWIKKGHTSKAFTRDSVLSAKNICQLTIQYQIRDIKPWHYFQRLYMGKLVGPFLAAASYHHEKNEQEQKQLSINIAKAFQHGSLSTLQEDCKTYKSFN